MVEFAIIAWLIGAAISLRFRVFALVPAIAFMLVLVATAEISRGETIWWIAAATLSVAVSAQLGYFVGSVLRFVMIGAPEKAAPAGIQLSLERENYHYQKQTPHPGVNIIPTATHGECEPGNNGLTRHHLMPLDVIVRPRR